MKPIIRTVRGLLYASLVAFYVAFIAAGLVFLWRGLQGPV